MDELDEEALLYTATLVKEAKVKYALYEKAAKKYNSSRAYNNIAALKLREGKTAEAKAALNKMSEKTASYYNTMGVVALQEADYQAAAKNFAKSDLKESKINQGVLHILNGNYPAAAQALAGSNTCNEPLAYILVKDYAKASGLLKGKCANQSYMRAIVAARQGDAATAKKELEAASKSERLAKRALTDIEFAKVK